jgi:IS1 family transposase
MVQAPGLLHIGGTVYFIWAYPPNDGRTALLLEPFGITRYHTDSWSTYACHLVPGEHHPGKRNAQKIERKHLTLRMRMTRLVRKTMCFSKPTRMHDSSIGLFVNRSAFGRMVST